MPRFYLFTDLFKTVYVSLRFIMTIDLILFI